MAAPVIYYPRIEYPESYGEPMGEGDWHRIWMNSTIERLQRYFAGQRVYVAGNMMIYYVEGNAECCICPDTFVARDCEPGHRTVYRVWEDGPMPDFAFEISSESTWREDRSTKLQLFARLGIKEYVMYDWSGRWLKPALQGFRLAAGNYRAIEGDTKTGFALPHLGVTFRLDGSALTMLETATGKLLFSNDELVSQTTRSPAGGTASRAPSSRRGSSSFACNYLRINRRLEFACVHAAINKYHSPPPTTVASMANPIVQ
jgi:Uma2 family endonuclease